MAKKKSLIEAIDDSIGHKKERKKQREKPKQPITSEQLGKVECAVANISDQLIFLQEVFVIFAGSKPELRESHCNGIQKILGNIHADSYKVLDLLEELDKQAVDK